VSASVDRQALLDAVALVTAIIDADAGNEVSRPAADPVVARLVDELARERPAATILGLATLAAQMTSDAGMSLALFHMAKAGMSDAEIEDLINSAPPDQFKPAIMDRLREWGQRISEQ
jgi:hypothetical protein